VLAGLLGTPLAAAADPTLESIAVRCGEGPDARCALQLEFSQPIHLGHVRFAIRCQPDGDFAPAPALAADPERSRTVYLRLPPASRGELAVRWSVRSADGQQVLRREERVVHVRARG
jgi:hypothetical protein